MWIKDTPPLLYGVVVVTTFASIRFGTSILAIICLYSRFYTCCNHQSKMAAHIHFHVGCLVDNATYYVRTVLSSSATFGLNNLTTNPVSHIKTTDGYPASGHWSPVR